jgi:RHS repeat-associated protein
MELVFAAKNTLPLFLPRLTEFPFSQYAGIVNISNRLHLLNGLLHTGHTEEASQYLEELLKSGPLGSALPGIDARPPLGTPTPLVLVTHETTEENIRKALDAGINFVDTANVYGNGTSMSSTFYDNGTPNVVSLMKGSTPLYNATYAYDGAGNITSISSITPASALNASFAYDSLNRLTSATYSTGNPGTPLTYGYEYDAYGNMLTVRHDGGVFFNKTYDVSNRINEAGYIYDTRGNLTAKPGSFYEWDAQSRLRAVRDAAGQYLADYRYDDRGRRIASFPPQPDINVVNYPPGSNADLTASLQTSAYKTFTITNLGLASLNIGGLTREGPDMAMFTVTQAPATIVPPGQSTEFTIRFLPTSTGDKTATLSIASDDPDENPYVIQLRGFCEPEIAIGGVPNGGTFDFGEVTIGQYESETLYIHNDGTATLVLSEGWPIVLEQPGGQYDFSLESQSGGTEIPAAGSNSFTVRFAPAAEGLRTATVTIRNNDLNEDPYTITIAGTGLNGPQKIIDDSELTLLSPNGGEELVAGTDRPITWTGGGRVKDVKLEYSADNGTTYHTIAERFANVGTYPWRVPEELSGSCLVRISDADGAPTAPVLVSFEFNFRVSAAEGDTQASSHFVFRAGLPDLKTQSFQVAEVAFAPDGVRGSENLLFNHALGEVQALDLFLSRWHHARITYDMSNYSGSVWVDSEPILTDIPLQTDLDVQRPAEISLSRSQDVPVKLWIDDLDVRFVDKSHMGQNQPEVAFRPLFRDNFNRYESALFPKDGGWLPGLEQARSGEQRQGETAEEGTQVVRTEAAAVSSGIDDGVYASSAKSFKLEGSQDEPGTVVKKFSIPERIPYCVTADNFAIVSSGEEARVERAGGGISEKENGKEVKRQKRGDDDRSGRRRGRAADRRQADSSRSGTNSLRRDAAEEPGSSKMTAGPFPSGTYYIYSFDGRLLAEYNILGHLVRDYIYFGGQLVAEYRQDIQNFYYYASDQINSTRIVTDSAGTVVYSAAHNPYGGIQKTWVNSYDPSLKFSGKQHDEESELDYFGARYYDRSLYRFLSVDPIIPALAALKDPQRWNLYGYCRGDPINYLDPDGEQTIDIMRYRYGTDATYGIYRIELGDKTIYGYTLEPARGVGKGPIPEGEYDAIPYWWSKKGYQVYWLQDVPGFT